MTDRELRKLHRSELLELLIAQGKENVALQERLTQAEEAVQTREMTIREAGSMASAAVEINDLIGAAQRAVDLYTENIYRVCLEQEAKAEKLVDEAQTHAEQMVSDADECVERMTSALENRALEIVRDARMKAERLMQEAEEQASQLLDSTRQECDRMLHQANADAELIRQQAEQHVDTVPVTNKGRRSFWKRSKGI
ncbi:MAG: hypothetical protein IJX84_02480 [Clostridia bacterium]|nr:hypothetical protein [Clostridia bacterium]